ncbi:peptidoglycan recognition protein family protein [Vagococcus salmoninarum]|uniref:N-acetylmuramoyl-L-alanine amidase domain-containing protein n=1 Tax=Vagococcus salmoninarum TaxID=2739 RepID=A0A429ZSQ1_9ENTE|nr:N-acetylmuramoyl-L-alanine amidase [Vagococcus salmoninarum]RST96668.1 hypothetical protein CBF35_05395 [Vagococcus salmoninarum]
MEIINKSVCRGVAGKRQGKVKGIVIHNDAGSINATAKHYVSALEKMNNSQLTNGFAHYYIDRNTVARVEDTFNQAWHTANVDGNANYIGYEVCQSIGASDADFLANEQATFKQVAEDLKFYGLEANRNTVKLHREFVATACPHRSWDLHGKSVNSVKDYYISQINKYMDGGATVAKVKYRNKKGKYEALKDLSIYNDKERKNRSTLITKKGSRFIIDEIVQIKGSVPVGKLRAGGYITLRDDFIKPY